MSTSGRRAASKPFFRKLGGVVIAAVMATGTIVGVNSMATANTNFTVPAGGLNFTSPTDDGNVTAGTVRTYTDIDGNGTVAKVEVVSVVNSRARLLNADWSVGWGDFDEIENTQAVSNYRVAYRIWPDSTFTITSPVSATAERMTVTTSRQMLDPVFYEFKVFAYDANDVIVGESSMRENDDGSLQPNEATYSRGSTNDRLHYIDMKQPNSSVIDGFLRTEIRRVTDNVETSARIKVSFESSQGVARTFTNLRLNSYDIDNSQYLVVHDFDNAGGNKIQAGSNIDSITESSARNWKVTAKSSGTTVVGTGNAAFSDPGSTSYSTGKVSIEYDEVSEIEISFGYPGGSSNASFEFDFGDRVAAAVASSTPAASGGFGGIAQKVHISTIDRNPKPGQVVAMFGSYFGGVTEVYVGGVKAEIVSKIEGRVNIRMPRGLTGALDVELKSPLGSLLLPKHFTIGKLPAAGTRKATIIVGGFDHNSRKLTARMKARIDRWLERNSDLSTLTCTGFTSLPRRTTDVELSTNRGTTACAYAKSQRPEVTTSVSQGIEDPRPGSTVRRVRLVLTP